MMKSMPEPVVEHEHKHEKEHEHKHERMHEKEHEHKHGGKLSEKLFPLWRRHMMWMHSLVISVVEGLSDVQHSSRRVLTCNTEILDCLKPHFSNEIAGSLAELLNQNLVFTVQLAQAVKGGNQKNIAEAWERQTHNTGHMMDAMKKGDHGIDCEKLGHEYAEYQEMLKNEMTYKVTKRHM